MIKVLYEDNHLIAVFKPAGVLSQGDKGGDESLFLQVKKYIKAKSKKPGNVFLGLLHRLDRPVCGIILFAKTSKGASRLSEQFRIQKVQKTYQAVVLGKPEPGRRLISDFLVKSGKRAKSFPLGKKAVLFYEVLKTNNKYSLLKIKIKTGKFHQIRFQLSYAGFPIVGDVKYGAPFSLPDRSIALCATNLVFETATGGKTVKLSIDPPANWLNLDFLGGGNELDRKNLSTGRS